jgi:L-alanine-DL-glutamate epimerase-like enolase superfamily enzyme
MNSMHCIITRFEIHKLHIPVGRVIGDSMCHYEAFRAVVVRLTTATGDVGWGFGEKAYGGHFAKEASWDRPVPPLAELEQRFLSDHWRHLEGRTPAAAKQAADPHFSAGDDSLTQAVRMALWDLIGKEAGLPLYRLLGGPNVRNSIRSYASACEFQQPDEFLTEFYGRKAREGFRAFKIKVGHPDPEHDLRRLLLTRAAVGPDCSLAADANKAWTPKETVERITLFNRHFVDLAYIEDPMDPSDLDGYRYLTAHCPVPVVGHDYVPVAEDMRPLLETHAILMLRARSGLDYGLGLLPLAREFQKPVIATNTLFEWNIHFALAFPEVDRIEFSDQDWNLLPKTPIRIKDGMMSAPETPGHGFEPKPEIFEQWKIND